MKSLALLYFSAVGSTKVVAELLAALLEKGLSGSGGESGFRIALAGIEEAGAAETARSADFLVLCYPTYYLKPAPPMRRFAAGLGPFSGRKPCYLVTTCELYSENSTRRLAKMLASRGLSTAGSMAIRSPGSDVTAVLPAALVPWLYRYGRRFEERLRRAAAEIAAAAVLPAPAERIPPPRWYTPLTQLLQILALNHFDAVKHRLRVLEERCTTCGLCAAACPASALTLSPAGVRIGADKCLLCCRCVHGCPSRAIVVFGGLKDNRRIDAALLAGLKEQAETALGLGAGKGKNA